MGATLVSEAWISPQKYEIITQVLPPHLDPDRKRVAILVTWGREGKKYGIFFIENNKLVMKQIDVVNFDSWLDLAFKNEHATKSKTRNNRTNKK